MRVVAVTAHQIPDRAPLRIVAGDRVGIGERDRTWPAFVFVTSGAGAGWVPARHLFIDGDTGTVVEPYDTTELPTEVGEMLDVIAEDRQSGWLWCRSAAGREGWVPIETVDRDAD